MKDTVKNRGFLSYAVMTVAVAIAAVGIFAGYRVGLAEFYFGRALRDVAANRGNGAYNNMIKAIRTNPFEARYRVSYSQLNLALANNIAARGASNKEGKLSDQDRQTIQQLISQSIAEAKNAVALNRLSAGSWANLANIYRQLLNIAQGADQWAIATYRQAIQLNPNDPVLRLTYGQLLYGFNQFDAAQRQFEAAVTLKPDYSNAHFNLASALSAQEKYQQAQFELQQTLQLVDAGTQDYKTVQNELDKIKDKLEKETKQETGSKETSTPQQKPELTSPEEATAGAELEPKIKLPEKQAAPEITPGTTEEPSPTASAPSPTLPTSPTAP